MREQKPQVYGFDDFRLEVSNRQLLHDGRPVALPAKAFDMLVVLIENGGRLVGKDELFGRVWPDQIVEESNLAVHVSAIRKALGEKKDNPRYLVTVPGYGYRFTGNVLSLDEEEEEVAIEHRSVSSMVIESSQGQADPDNNALIKNTQRVGELTASDGVVVIPRRRAVGLRALLLGSLAVSVISAGAFLVLKRTSSPGTTVSAVPIKSIAVLPFKPLVASERDESLEIGMAETLITRLSRIGQLTVRPTSAVRQYNGLEQDAVAAGRELRVESVLDGSLQRAGDRLRVSVRLVRAADGQTLWSERFDESANDIFAVQDAISRKVAGALAMKLGGEERARLSKHDTDSSEAYELYLKGRYFWDKFTPADHQKATEYFNQAIAKDPSYAVAYAGLADTYGASATNGWLRPNEAYPKAKLTVQKALSLDERLAEAHANLGALFMFYDLDWVSAEREYRRAIELNPDYEVTYEVYSYLLCALGRPDEGVTMARRALQVNPLSGPMANDLALAYYQARQYDAAIDQYQKTLEMEPTRGEALLGLGMVYEQKSMYEEAINQYQKAIASLGRTSPVLAQLGHAYAMSGKKTEAIKVVGEFKEIAKQGFRGSYD